MTSAAGLGQRAASGALFVGVAQGAKAAMTMASTIVVARLLTPHDYGAIAMASPITGFLLIFQNLGLNQAVIQRDQISDAQLNALFWMNMMGSAAIAALLLAISPLVSGFYGDPRAGNITAASAATVLLTGSALQHSALLNRHLKFATLSLIDVATSVTTFVATAIAAWALRSYWALWIGAFVATGVNVALLWIVDRWRPSLKVSWGGTRGMLNFGANVTGFNLLNFFARNMDNVLIARVWGAGALGLYDRAYKLMMFPLQNINNPLSRVMVPILARVQSEPERYRRSFLLSLRMITLASVPGLAAATILSDELVPFLLGQRWAGASPIFFWLGLSGILQPLTNTTGWLFISTGRGAAMVRWGVLISVSTLIAIVVGLRWGPVGVAAAYCINDYLIRTPTSFWLSTRTTSVKARDYYLTLAPLAAGALLTWGYVALARGRLDTPALIGTAVAFAYVASLALQTATADGRAALARMAELGGKALGPMTQRLGRGRRGAGQK